MLSATMNWAITLLGLKMSGIAVGNLRLEVHTVLFWQSQISTLYLSLKYLALDQSGALGQESQRIPLKL